jgi:hypothetical protein
MDTARPHYKKTWPPVLYASTLWLNETGFTTNYKADGESIGAALLGANVTSNVPAKMNPEEVNSNRFYLILGRFLQYYIIRKYLLFEFFHSLFILQDWMEYDL